MFNLSRQQAQKSTFAHNKLIQSYEYTEIVSIEYQSTKDIQELLPWALFHETTVIVLCSYCFYQWQQYYIDHDYISREL